MNMHSPRPPVVMSEARVSLVGALMVLLGPVSMSLFTPAMPELVHVFGTTESMVKMTLSAYFAGFAVTQLVCGPLSDAYGRKPVTLAFTVIYVGASALAVFAPTAELLIGARFLQGVGAAVGIAVSRALVRDLFTGEASSRIMNLTSLLMGLGPAIAPTVGGLLLEALGWQAIFVFMLLAGLFILAMLQLLLVETVKRDSAQFRPRTLARSYATLFGDRYFMLASAVLGGGIGAFYTQATILPFILMDRAGFTPSQFGLAMLLQSGPFFVGGLIFRGVMARVGSKRLIPVGIVFMAVGYTSMFMSMATLAPGLLTVMLPVAAFTFGVAFIMPAMSTATVAPFPHMAGAASALSSFLQMGTGFAGGIVVAVIGDPVIGMMVVVPLMGFGAITAWAIWRRLPEPALARVVMPPATPDEPL